MQKRYLLILLILIFVSCIKEKPFTPPEGLKIKETTITQAKEDDYFFNVKRNMGGSLYLLLGKYKDEYTSRVLLQFKDFPDSAVINSAEIILVKKSILGDSSVSFEANMYEITNDWEEYGIKYWHELSADSSNLLSTATITATTGDTVSFPIQPQLVHQWMDTTKNFGVWIDCDEAEFIADFYTRALVNGVLAPNLKLIYTKNDTLDTTVVYASRDAFILINSGLDLDTNFVYVGRGIAFRSYLKFSIPDVIDSTYTINRAELKLTINNENSIFDAAGASYIKTMLVSSMTPEPATIDSSFTGFPPNVSDSLITINITSVIQSWSVNNYTYPNNGFILQMTDENQTLARVALYSSRGNSSLEPHIHITYSVPAPH